MKKLLAAILAATTMLALFTGCNPASKQSVEKIKESGELVMYTNAEFPPFEYVDGSEPIGVDIDIANEIAKDLGVKLVVQNVKFDTIIGSIQSGKGALGIAGITVNEERQKAVDFSKSYTTATQYMIIKDDSIKNLEGLMNKKVGVQTGTTGDLLISGEVDGNTEDGYRGVLKGSSKPTGYNNALEASQDLINGRLDAVVIDKLVAESIVASNPNKGLKAVELVYADGSKNTEEYAIAVAKGNTSLLEQVNKTLDRLNSEGKIKEFILNHTTK